MVYAEERCMAVHIDDQEFVEILYVCEAGFDGDFPYWSLFILIEPLDDRASMLEMSDSKLN